MSYFRKIARKQIRTQTQQVDKQTANNTLSRNIFSTLMALSFFAYPLATEASDIVKTTGEICKPDGAQVGGNTYRVLADRIIDNNIAVNNFSKFNVSANDVVNLKFHTANSTIEAKNLVNLVKDKIDIYGTVNAARAGSIGGNLFFLSSQGIAVHAGGVINSGSLTMITPSAGAMNSMTDIGIKDMVANPKKIELNPEGSIEVNGIINTRENVLISSGHSVVLNEHSKIETGVKEFSKLVKLTSDFESEKLKAKIDSNGDVELLVNANDFNVKDNAFKSTINNGNNTVEAKISQQGVIAANGEVVIAATATSEKERVAQTVAQVDVNGSVSGSNVQITADAKNKFEDDGKYDNLKGVSMEILGALSLNLDADYAVLGSKAIVNIGENAKINAVSNNVNSKEAVIKASSNLKIDLGSKTSTLKIANANHSASIPATAVAYASAKNDAQVNMNGSLTSKYDAKILANSKTDLSVESVSATTNESNDKNVANMSLAIVQGENTSSVNIGKSAQISKDLSGNLTIASDSQNSLFVNSESKAPDETALSTAINIVQYKSDATTDIAANLAADGVNISANNILNKNTIVTENTIGSEEDESKKGMFPKTQASIMDRTDKANSLANNLVGKIGTFGKVGAKIEGMINSPPQEKNIVEKLGEMMSAGVAVQYVDEKNTSKVHIHDVNITSSKDLNISSLTDIRDTMEHVSGTANNKQKDSKVATTISGAVLVSSMDNSSQVIIEGVDNKNNKLVAGGNTKITSSTNMPYNRVNTMVADLEEALGELKKTYDGNNYSYAAEYKKIFEKLNQSVQELRTVTDKGSVSEQLADFALKSKDVFKYMGQFTNLLGKDTKATGEYISKPKALLEAAAKFLKPEQYTNFYVRTETSENSKQDDKNKGFAVAGSVNINSINNDATVLIGKNTGIQTQGEVDVKSITKGGVVSFTGNASSYLMPESANKSGAGLSVAVENFSGNSITLIGEGADIKAASVNINANNKLMRTGIVFSAGTAGANGLSGMVDVMVGDSNALAVVDDEAQIHVDNNPAGKVSITSDNDTVLTNVSGGFMKTEGTAVGVGAAINLYNVNTVAGVFNNDADADTTIKGSSILLEKTDDKIKNAQKLSQRLLNLNKDENEKYLGTTSVHKQGGIQAPNFVASSNAQGVINSVGVAGAVASEKSEGGFLDKVGDFFDEAGKKIVEPINDKLDKLDDYMSGKINDKTGYKPTAAVNSGTANAGQGASGQNSVAQAGAQDSKGSAKVSIAGSVAVNSINGQTATVVDGANINILSNNTSTDVKKGTFATYAEDKMFIGSWAGGAGVSWGKSKNNSVGIGGAAGVNLVDQDLLSVVRNTTINNAGDISNIVHRSGANVAAGLGMAITKGAGNNTSVAASVSYNDLDNDAHALMINDNVKSDQGINANVTNSVYNNDVQVTGGVNVSAAIGGDQGIAVGASIVISKINNDLQSGIYNGKYEHVSKLDVTNVLATKQISAGVGVGFSTSSKGGAFEGVGVYNELSNTSSADINGANIDAETVMVQAYDSNSANNDYSNYISSRGLDPNGGSYRDAVKHENAGSAPSEQDYNKALDDSMDKADKSGGNLIVTGALSVAGSAGNAGLGAAVAVDIIKNDITSNISSSNIKAKQINSISNNDTLLVGVAAGAAGSGKFGGAGSVSWQNIENSAVSTISKSSIQTNNLNIESTNGMLGVNVAGQISAGKVAAGLALAYSGLDNKTGAYIKGSSVTAYDNDNFGAVKLSADSKAKIFNVGAGVSASTGTAAINGTIAINRGANTTEAIISDEEQTRTDIKRSKGISVTATDDTRTLAIAGGVSAGAGTAVGGAVAINDIGGFSPDGSKSAQKITAKIINTDIETENADIKTLAQNDAHMMTFAVGVGASGNVAVQGSAATSLINQKTISGLENTNINKGTTNKNTYLESLSKNNSKIVANATVVAASGSVAIGAGVGVNRIVQSTEATMQGGIQNISSALINATSNPSILAIGIGGAGSGSVSIAGSTGINIIKNNAKAIVDSVKLSASGNIGVVAQSDEIIENYAGAISGSGAVALGLSTAVNTITGDTEATVSNSEIVAQNANEHQVKTSDNNLLAGAVINKPLSENSFKSSLSNARKEVSQKGLVVDSSATHSITSLMASAGGSGTVAVLGTVNVNNIGGTTKAQLLNTDVNKSSTDTATLSSLSVRASDYTNSAGTTVAATGSGNVAIGAAADTNIVNRNTAALVSGNSAKKNVLKSNNFDVSALAMQGLSNFDNSLAFAVEGANVAGTVSVNKLHSKTSAKVENMSVQYQENATVLAEHKDGVYVSNNSVGVAGAGASVAISVSTIAQESDVESVVDGSEITTNNVAKTAAKVVANNTNDIDSLVTTSSIAGAGGAASGNITVNNMKQNVIAKVTGSTIQAGSVDVTAMQKVNIRANGGSLAGGGIAGIGASVSVNTFDDSVGASVYGSTLRATQNDVNIQSTETRTIEQIAVNVAAGLGGASGNILVTNINEKITDQDAKKGIEKANESRIDSSNEVIGLTKDEKADISEKTKVGATVGGVDAKGVYTKVDASTLSAQQNVLIAANEKNAIDIHGGGAAIGAKSFGGSVGLLKMKHATSVSLNKTDISSENLSVKSLQEDSAGGGIKINLYQGTGGVLGLGAAYGESSSSGTTNIALQESNINVTKDLSIKAQDSSTVQSQAYGLTAGEIAAGAIVANANNDSSTSINLLKNTMQGENITIGGEKLNNIKAFAASGAVGVAGVSGAVSLAQDQGGSNVGLNGNIINATRTININSTNAPRVSSVADSFAGGLSFAGGVSVAKAVAKGAADITVRDSNQLKGSVVNIAGNIGGINNKDNNVFAKVVGIGISAVYDVNFNLAQSEVDMSTKVSVDDTKYKDDGSTELNVSALYTTIAAGDAYGLSIGGAVASGTNRVDTSNKTNANIAVVGSVAENSTNVQAINIRASGTAHNKSKADGTGGGLVNVSPLAAWTENSMEQTSNVDLKGKWKVEKDVNVSTAQKISTDILADSLGAAVLNASGAKANEKIQANSSINLDGAQIVSAGKQKYNSGNHMELYNKVKSSGYGAGALAASGQASNIELNGATTLKNSSLMTTGSNSTIIVEALTTGNVTNKNNIQSAGIVAGTFADSSSAIKYKNIVGVEKGSKLYTENENADIILAASDNTNVDLDVMADTQGGTVGAASAKNKSVFERDNTVAVDNISKITSAQDVNLYAGKDAQGRNSSLNYNVVAVAYNKTAIPLATSPTIENKMKQENKVALSGRAESVRHINMSANKGISTIANVAKEYKWLGGENGKGSITSSLLGGQSVDETTNNRVELDGQAVAGINNELDITFTGTVDFKEGLDNEIYMDLGKTSEWFKNTEWYKTNVNKDNKVLVSDYDVVGNLMERYDTVSKLALSYAPGSKNAVYYEAEKIRLEEILKETGFATFSIDENGKKGYTVSKNQPVKAIHLPNMIVSGGNINITADKLQGGGSLTAKGDPNLNIENRSGAYMLVGNTMISDNGGYINYNDAKYTEKMIPSFTGEVKQKKDKDGGNSTLSISGTTPSSNNFVAADIHVVGDVINKVGKVAISNANYNITIDSEANINGQSINISASNGSVTQSSRDGIINIGFDPVVKYKIADSITKKVQMYFVNKESNNITQGFENQNAYVNWILANITDLTDVEKQQLNASLHTPDTGAGIHAGGNIYINGVDVHIAGLVQSGYSKYTATLTGAEAEKISLLDQKNIYMTDADVIGNAEYLIHGNNDKKAALYDPETRRYNYDIPLYYNPTTKHIVSDNVKVQGGKIYITGAISSMGDGRILAANGAADISIDTTKANRDLVLNGIENKNISGLIKITDTNFRDSNSKPLVTEYKNDSVEQYYQGDNNKIPVSNDVYKPAKNLAYHWTGGIQSTTVKKYEYTKKFLAWGIIHYGASDIINSGWATTAETNTHAGTSMDTGVVISKDGDFGNNKFSISSNKKALGTEQYSVVKTTKEWSFWEKLIGTGTLHYEFTGTSGNVTDVIYSGNASQDISIGFLNAGEDKINASAQGSVLLNGGVANATSKGITTLSSAGGMVANIVGNNKNIVSDNLSASAQLGIDLQHQALGNDAKIKLTTSAGNVIFNSNKGNLHLSGVYTGTGYNGIKVETGNVSIKAEGSILQDKVVTGDVIKGKRVDLLSRSGSIGENGVALNIETGAQMYEADSMATTINAEAEKDIFIKRAKDGNMRIGEIKSHNGDVVLEVANGSFVDGLRDTENYDGTGVDKKVKYWSESGLISAEDQDGESGAAAATAKGNRVDALKNRAVALGVEQAVLENAGKVLSDNQDLNRLHKDYLQALNSGNQTNATEALNAYQTKQNELLVQYAQPVRDLIVAWSEINSKDASYGWSKNQLLYAIQDGILNSLPGSVQYVKTANITANNITLNAPKGGIGIDGTAKSIKYDKISDIENLRLLATAKAGDLTWKNSEEELIVRQQQAINVALNNTDGRLNVVGNDNVYLAGKEGTSFNISNINTAGDIKLMSQNGIFATTDKPLSTTGTWTADMKATLSGKSLTATGGKGSIGSKDSMILTDLSGTVDANSGEGIYIYQIGAQPLTVQNAAGKELYLKAQKDILMSDIEGKDMGYLNSEGQINLYSAEGSLGNSAHGIRILNNAAPINADAKDIYLQGVQGETMLLGNIDAKGLVQVNSEGSIELGRIASEVDGKVLPAVEGSIIAADNSELVAVKDIVLNGAVEISNKDLTLTAKGGKIQETAQGSLKSDKLTTISKNAVILENTNNHFNTLNVDGFDNKDIAGDVLVKTNSEHLQTKVNNHVNGSIELSNLQDKGKLSIADELVASGHIDVRAKGTVETQKLQQAGEYINLSAEQGDVLVKGSLLAGTKVDVGATEGNISVTGSITSKTGDTNLTATDTNAQDNKGNISVGGEILSGKNIAMNTTHGDIETTGSVKAQDGNVSAVAQQDGNIKFLGDLEASQNVTANTGNGDIDFNGEINAKYGNISSLVANAGDISFKKSVSAGKDISAKTGEEGSITFNGTVVAEGNIDATANNKGNINLVKNITAGLNATLQTNNGSILFNGNDNAQTEDIIATAKNGNIKLVVTGQGDIKDTNRVLNGDRGFLKSENGNVTIEHRGVGDVDLYEVFAKKDAKVSVKDGDLHLTNINGELVAVLVKNPKKVMDVKHIVAGTQIQLSGSDVNIDDVSQRPGRDNMLIITPNASEDDMPIDKLNIGDIRVNNGVIFEHLWAKKANIKVSQGSFFLDKLYILDKATFATSAMKTNIFGTPPVREENVQSVYWNNTAINNPKTKLSEWMSESPNPVWAYLRFMGQSNVQLSNGNLLSLNNYYYVYDQRYTQENLMRLFMDKDFYAQGYDGKIAINEYNRSSLDVDDSSYANASPDELKVEK